MSARASSVSAPPRRLWRQAREEQQRAARQRSRHCHERGAIDLGAFVDHFARLPAELGLPTTLREVGVAEADIGSLAANAMLQTRLLPNNPREVHLDDAERIYRAAL